MAEIRLSKFPVNRSGGSLRLTIAQKNYVRDHYKEKTPAQMAQSQKANYSSVIGFMLSEGLTQLVSVKSISE